MEKSTIDFRRFPNLPYTNKDILEQIRISAGQALPPSLEGVIDLMEGRDHLYWVRVKERLKGVLKGVDQLLIKPFEGDQELHVIVALRDSEISLVLGFNEDYFVEERVKIPSVESALANKSTYLSHVAPYLGKALYELHSRGVSYNGKLDNHFYADDITGRFKLRNFSKAGIDATHSELVRDAQKALQYLQSLSSRTIRQDQSEKGKRKEQIEELSKAVSAFRVGYVRDSRTERALEGAAQSIFYCLEGVRPIVKVLKMIGYK